MASDASFADNQDRASLIGYIIYLFNSPIDWLSKKQCYVILLTTEAELLALTTAVKRFFKQIEFSSNQHFSILYNNHQTVKILTDKNFLFWTSLKYINIINY
ncbi:hypothetical protein BO70DRAFT_282721 [Aspergillus heteromorphus CBS 117.55]|uniref:Reverse transcriptase Ty1/copia-type domain-containing protein n=1 Tax=Aspergillus heteromorphus CBS 117.55 TaxID=1448321 RepID=A0A317X0L9_9EURO|nr:uncharacterized protein BO70DRAFT_282721 [Aspergillus heteromorphus CBS 117.55]PWY92103.1 hypothetical protein BO70DRAFT_282721 [Aspergillus heteromorphus CBS 117.55]